MKENFPFITKEAVERQEQTLVVVNVMERAGLESLQHIEGERLTGEQAVDIDDRALRNPEAPNVCFGRPHAGEYVPVELLGRMPAEVLTETLVLIDKGTGNIFRSENVPSVGTKMNRFIVDPNRHPLPGEKLRPSRVPGSVLWKKGVSDQDLYLPGQEPNDQEIRDYTERFYLPYYNSLLKVVGALADRRKNGKERILMIDGHSFPTSGPLLRPIQEYLKTHYGMAATIDQLPMFILGDIDGSGCDEDVRIRFRKALERNFSELDQADQRALAAGIGGGVALENSLFKGVHNVDFWSGYDGREAQGRKIHGVNALQVECNEAMYTDPKSGRYDFDRLNIVQRLIEKAALEVSAFLKQV